MLLIGILSILVSNGSSERHFPGKCSEILDEIAITSSSLLACMLKSSFPWFESCRKCGEHYQQMQDVHSRLEETIMDGNISCRDLFYYGSKLNLVEEVYGDGLRAWQRPDCPACYEISGDDGVLDLKNETVQFFRHFHEYFLCRQKHSNNASNICMNCRSAYDQTKTYFTDKMKSGLEASCLDVTDTWNKTQEEWSVEFGCPVYPKDVFLLAAFTTFILVLPIIFYVSIYLNSEVQRQSIDRMKRVSTSIYGTTSI